MENININTIENSKSNIVTNMKEDKNRYWSNGLGVTNIFFQEAVNKGGNRRDGYQC